MKHKKISVLYYLFLILIILIFSYVNSQPTTEPFIPTPNLKQYYRPILRNTRVAAENFGTKTSEKINETFQGLYKNLGLK